MTEPMDQAAAARVLVVDDNTANLQLLAGLLVEHGYHAFPASDGELALEFARATPPDLVLLDLKMPGIDGEEVCRRLKADERTRPIPVIFISALESGADRVRCFRAGGVDYISKPFRPEEVLARVETHLALRRAQLDLERRNAELAAAHRELEDRVRARTADLAAANASLQAEVAERTKAEAALSASRLFLDQIIGAVADPVFVMDRQGRFVLVNEAMGRLTGRSREAAKGRPAAGAFPGEGGACFDARNAAVLAAGRADADEETLVDAAGTAHVFLIQRTIHRDERGEAFLVGAMRDVTDYKRMQEQVLQSQKMETVGLLAGGVAHDFNNLLAPILGYSELILGEMAGPHPWRDMLQDVLNAARSGKSLTQRLLAFSRKQRFELVLADSGELVRRFEPMIRRMIREDVAIRLDVPPGLPPVRADPAQIQQVLANLAVNAQDAMPRGGTLSLGVKEVQVAEGSRPGGAPPGRYVEISVADTGTGMAPETIAHLFEPFFTTKEPGKGTGLGLSTAFGIVKQHGGAIEVASTPGEGSTFRVLLPVAPEPEVAAAARAEEVPGEVPGGSETIVVAEDDERVRMATVRMLTRLGYRVLEAADPERCLAVVRSHDGPIALLVTDVIMPGMHGRALFETLQRTRPELKVLFMSGYPSVAVGGKEILGPDDDFLQKPFSHRDLAYRVRAVLDRPGASGARPGA